MVGVFTNQTFDSPEQDAQQQQADQNPQTSLGERAGAIFEGGIAPSLARRPGAALPEAYSGRIREEDVERPPSPMIGAQAAQALFGIGDLKFTQPIREDDAQTMRDNKINEMRRADVLERTPPGIGSGVANFVLGATLDPVSDAAYALPGFGEARLAKALGGSVNEAGHIVGLGMAGRSAVRFGAGAASNASIQAGLDVARLGIAHDTGEDFTPMDALTDVAGGALIGGIVHGGIGAAGDILTGRYMNSLEGHLDNTNFHTGDAAMKTAMAQMLSDRPIEVRPFFQNDLQERLMASTVMPEDFTSRFAFDNKGTQLPPEKASEVVQSEIQRMMDQSVHPGPQEAATQYAAGKIKPDIQNTMDKAEASMVEKPMTFEEHGQLAKDMGDSIERDIKQAVTEERMNENIPELEQANEKVKDLMSKTPWYETLASCMTQEVE